MPPWQSRRPYTPLVLSPCAQRQPYCMSECDQQNTMLHGARADGGPPSGKCRELAPSTGRGRLQTFALSKPAASGQCQIQDCPPMKFVCRPAHRRAFKNGCAPACSFFKQPIMHKALQSRYQRRTGATRIKAPLERGRHKCLPACQAFRMWAHSLQART